MGFGGSGFLPLCPIVYGEKADSEGRKKTPICARVTNLWEGLLPFVMSQSEHLQTTYLSTHFLKSGLDTSRSSSIHGTRACT
uniref:Uncharacterized protein n=1 Tax=Labrus bergylta TaxID=56723 RepID=A0A3Q3FFD0_9LABR